MSFDEFKDCCTEASSNEDISFFDKFQMEGDVILCLFDDV